LFLLLPYDDDDDDDNGDDGDDNGDDDNDDNVDDNVDGDDDTHVKYISNPIEYNLKGAIFSCTSSSFRLSFKEDKQEQSKCDILHYSKNKTDAPIVHISCINASSPCIAMQYDVYDALMIVDDIIMTPTRQLVIK